MTGEAELRDAGHLWGKITGDAEAAIKEELGDPKIEVTQVGPAGERLSRLACIINMSNRAHGRTGMGAVMGSKNLKAIAVRGHSKVNVANQKAVTKLARQAAGTLADFPDMQGMQDYGTASVFMFQDTVGGLPTRNWLSGTFAEAEALSGETMTDTILKHNDTCYACSVRCKRVVETEYKGAKVDPLYGGPEYETLSTIGSYCCVGDLHAVSLANQICAQNGLDTISTGATIAFAMDCFEQGILTLADTGGIELRFGDADAMLAILDKIVRREGLGDLLANGSAYAAAQIGRGAEDLVVAVKNMELPAHMPQVKRSLEVVYAVNPFGADHQSSEHDPGYTPGAYDYSLKRMAEIGLTDPQDDRVMNREKVKLALYTMYNYSFMDSANLCQFVYGPSWQLIGPAEMAELASRGHRLAAGRRRYPADRRAPAEPDAGLQRARRRGPGARHAAQAAVRRAAARRRLRRPLHPARGAGAGAGRLLRDGRLGCQRRAHDSQAGGARAGVGDVSLPRHCRRHGDTETADTFRSRLRVLCVSCGDPSSATSHRTRGASHVHRYPPKPLPRLGPHHQYRHGSRRGELPLRHRGPPLP